MSIIESLRKPRGLGYLNMLLYILTLGAPGDPIKSYRVIFVFSCCAVVYLVTHAYLSKKYKDLWIYVGVNVFIIFCQLYTLGYVNGKLSFFYIMKVFWGGFLFITLGYQFKYVYLRVMFHLAIISLIFWGIAQVTGDRYSIFDTGGRMKYYSLIIYCSRVNEIARNCGCFWEPGAYGCYLCMLLIFFVNEMPKLVREHFLECVVLVAALLSTRSTTAWLTFGVFLLAYFVLKMRSWVKYAIIPAAFFGALTVYETTEFLQEKVDAQTESSLESGGKEWNASRLGSLLFDLHYIKKHPFFGNGLDEKTLYADHPGLAYAIKTGREAASGNGFSGQAKMMGLCFYAIFLYLFFKRNKHLSAADKILILLTFTMLLQGEYLQNYCMCLTLCLCVWSDPPKTLPVKSQSQRINKSTIQRI